MSNAAKEHAVRPSRKDVFLLTLDQLALVEGFNVRYDYGDIGQLMNSIIENGLKTPMRGFKDGDVYRITDGHRRYMALERILEETGLSDIKIPFLVEDRNYNDEKRILDMVISNSGKPLTMLEEAMVYERLHNYGWSDKEIAKKVGCSTTHVHNCSILMSAPSDLINKVKKNIISATNLLELIRAKSDNEVVQQIVEKAEEISGGNVKAKHVKTVLRSDEYRYIDPKAIQALLNEVNKAEGEKNEDVMNAFDAVMAHCLNRITKEEMLTFFMKN